jgi:hypothetical protein
MAKKFNYAEKNTFILGSDAKFCRVTVTTGEASH